MAKFICMVGGTGRLPGQDVCRDWTFAGAGRLPGLDVCRDGRLPGWDVCLDRTFVWTGRLPRAGIERLPGRDICLDGTFAETGCFSSQVYRENVSTRDESPGTIYKVSII